MEMGFLKITTEKCIIVVFLMEKTWFGKFFDKNGNLLYS